jgi:hypothetical protein
MTSKGATIDVGGDLPRQRDRREAHSGPDGEDLKDMGVEPPNSSVGLTGLDHEPFW